MILQRDIEDPLIGFATITDVEVSADLRHAKVFVSVLGDQESKQNTIRGLVRGRKFIRGLLGDRIALRTVPQLTFHLDETAEQALRIETLLRETAEEDGDPNEADVLE